MTTPLARDGQPFGVGKDSVKIPQGRHELRGHFLETIRLDGENEGRWPEGGTPERQAPCVSQRIICGRCDSSESASHSMDHVNESLYPILYGFTVPLLARGTTKQVANTARRDIHTKQSLQSSSKSAGVLSCREFFTSGPPGWSWVTNTST